MRDYSFLVRKYLNGEEIENLDELKDNKDFMLAAIRTSKDKRLIGFCPDSFLKDYDFIISLLDIFKDDYKFCINIVKDIKETLNAQQRMEIACTLKKIIGNKDEELKDKCSLKVQAMYLFLRTEIEAIKKKSKDEEIKEELARGFTIFSEDFAEYPLALKYIAEQMILEIIYEIEDFEGAIHRLCRTKEILEKQGMVSTIANIIRPYDYALSDYIIVHPEILKIIDRKIRRIKKDYDDYDKKREERIWLNAIEAVENYYRVHESECDFTFEELIYRLGEELKIRKILINYYPFIYEGEKYLEKPDDRLFNIQSMKHYNIMKKMMISALKKQEINYDSYIEEEPETEPETEYTSTTKIIPFKKN